MNYGLGKCISKLVLAKQNIKSLSQTWGGYWKKKLKLGPSQLTSRYICSTAENILKGGGFVSQFKIWFHCFLITRPFASYFFILVSSFVK